MRLRFQTGWTVFALGLCLLAEQSVVAQTIVQKHFTWNVDSLVGQPAGPYSLNFQLVDGAGTGNGNLTVSITNAPFSNLTFDNSSFFQQADISFTPISGEPLQFDIAFSYTGNDSPTPDQFSIAALDYLGFELPTVGPADALATFDFQPGGLEVSTFGADANRTPAAGGDPIDFPAPVITDAGGAVVPEPGSALLFSASLAALACVSGRRKGLRP